MGRGGVLLIDWQDRFIPPPALTGVPEDDLRLLTEYLNAQTQELRELVRELHAGAIVLLGDAATNVAATAGSLRYTARPQWHDGTSWREFNGLGGGVTLAVTQIIDDYTALITDEIVECNSATALTVTLPAAADGTQVLTIKNIGAGTVTVSGTGLSETVAEDAVLDVYSNTTDWQTK